MKTMDFRVRPPIKSFLQASMYTDGARRDARFTRNFGFEPAPSAQQKSMPKLLEEMDAGGIDQAVILARVSDRYGGVTNEEIAVIVASYSGRLIGVGVVNPTTRLEAIRQIDQAMKLGLKAINLEPGILPAPAMAGGCLIQKKADRFGFAPPPLDYAAATREKPGGMSGDLMRSIARFSKTVNTVIQ